MELVISRDTLFRALQTVQGSVESRSSSMPILQNVLIEAEGKDKIRMLGTNLDISIQGVFEAGVEKAGKVTLNARRLFDIVRELPASEVRLAEEDGQWIRLKCERSNFRFPGLSASEFPALPDPKDSQMQTISAATLGEMIKKTMFSTSQDESRYVYNGVYMETEDGVLRLVATDGHRLAKIERDSGGMTLEEGVIVHRRALNELVKLLQASDGDVSLALAHITPGHDMPLGGDVNLPSLTANHVIVQMGDSVLTARLVDGDFPNYRQVIPQNNDHTILMDKEALAQALRRVSLFSSDSGMVRFEFSPGQLRLTTDETEAGEAEEVIESDAKEELTVGFNSRYCLDVLGVMDEEQVSMQLKDSLSPGILSPKDAEDYTYVIMPMRV